MNTTALRVVLDTNILIASIGRTSPYRWIFDAIVRGQLTLCISNEILLEYREILARKTSPVVAENLSQFLVNSSTVEKIPIFFNFGLIKADESDNKFVDCAIAANADCIVSHDAHFRVLSDVAFPRVTVLTVSEFEQEYRHTE